MGGAVILGSSSTVAAAASSAPSSTTPASLRVRVISVTGTVGVYVPGLASHGPQLERIVFTLRGAPSGSPVVCKIGMFHLGKQVGETIVGVGAATRKFAVVNVTGHNFVGKPSDAHMQCRIRTAVTVPNVVGQSVKSSRDPPMRKLSSLWLFAAVDHQPSTAPVGTVIAQFPPSGSHEESGGGVNLTVSFWPPRSP